YVFTPPATTDISTLSLHDALPILQHDARRPQRFRPARARTHHRQERRLDAASLTVMPGQPAAADPRPGSFWASSFFFRDSSGIAPLTRLPSAKNSAGLPCTFSLRPSARLAWIGVSHSACAGASPFSIQAFQALAGSAAHQMSRERVVESGERIGNRKV